MSGSVLSCLHQEWLCMQNQYDSYEKHSLIIKLVAIILCPTLLFIAHIGPWSIAFAGLLWLQDGIWKTYQNRIGERLLVLEKAISQGQEHQAMQFNANWLQSRQGSVALLKEYIGQSCKPTVAYPHVLLLILCIASLYVPWI
ncbi:MAG: hypothetical protein ACJA13_003031 [Paraglaciecola sp.]|jgi:hypothetical protein